MTPTREELLEARIAFLEARCAQLSGWLQGAEKGHRDAMMEADMLRQTGCCKGGEDANASD